MTVTYFDAITPGEKDYSAALVKIGSTHPDVLFYTGYYPEFGLLAKEYVALAPAYKLNGDSACADPSVEKVAGAAIANPGITIKTLPTTQSIHNARTTPSPRPTRPSTAASGRLLSYEYDGMMALAQALDNGGKTDAKSSMPRCQVTIADGITGQVHFDDKGDRPAAILAVQATGNLRRSHRSTSEGGPEPVEMNQRPKTNLDEGASRRPSVVFRRSGVLTDSKPPR
jgi:branched-chain amino acid transport system substrate-binding protein